jgi:hypothetical protein
MVRYIPVLVWKKLTDARIRYHNNAGTKAYQSSPGNNVQGGLSKGTDNLVRKTVRWQEIIVLGIFCM